MESLFEDLRTGLQQAIQMEKENSLSVCEKKIRGLFSEYPDVIFGFTEIGWSSFCGKYGGALVFAVLSLAKEFSVQQRGRCLSFRFAWEAKIWQRKFLCGEAKELFAYVAVLCSPKEL